MRNGNNDEKAQSSTQCDDEKRVAFLKGRICSNWAVKRVRRVFFNGIMVADTYYNARTRNLHYIQYANERRSDMKGALCIMHYGRPQQYSDGHPWIFAVSFRPLGFNVCYMIIMHDEHAGTSSAVRSHTIESHLYPGCPGLCSSASRLTSCPSASRVDFS